MSGGTVLVAAYSGRALAQSARRAGFIPLVADAFGDLDMRVAAADYRVVDGAMQTGFRAKPIVAALDQLVAEAPSAPIGLVLGSGFEDKTRLWDLLDNRYGVLGCKAETVRACKDPRVFFSLLDELGILHPETRLKPPDNPEGWISKRIGGSGGRHIRYATATSRARPRRYFQKQIDGERISFGTIASLGIAMSVTHQWCAPSHSQPCRYGGAVSLPYRDTPVEREMLGAVDRLSRELKLKGLVSFDFVVCGGRAFLLEINPRPGASLDVVDTDEGLQFSAHIQACRENTLPFGSGLINSNMKAAAILHADRGAIVLGEINWPEWSADRGAPGTMVPKDQPLATVFANGTTADAAEALARARLAELESLIYENAIA